MPYAICDTCGLRSDVATLSSPDECPRCSGEVEVETGRLAAGRARLRHHTAVIEDFVHDLIGRRQSS